METFTESNSVSEPDSEADLDQAPEAIHWKRKQLRLSINPYIVDKNKDRAPFDTGFKNRRVTIDQLAFAIRKGAAYCAELENGKRTEACFVASDILSVDIDEGMTLDELLRHELVERYGSLVYTTPSHTDEQPRLRVVFALERTIDSVQEMRAATMSLILRLRGDQAARDAARMFYGSSNCWIQTFDRGIPAAFLSELIDQGRNAAIKVKIGDRAELRSGRSDHRFPYDLQVRLATGPLCLIAELPKKTSIYCPFHNDRHSSAFVTTNLSGTNGIHCSTCRTTFWPQDESDDVDFTSFVRAAKAVHQHTHVDLGPGDGDYTEHFLRSVLDPDFIHPAGIDTIDQKFVGDCPVKLGPNFIKSPKGSGKTEFLKRVLAARPNATILLVGHRRSLIRQSCQRLDLACYLDDPPGSTTNSPRKNRYGVCLDSISKIPSSKSYDLVLIDESEQVLAHILSSTLGEKRSDVLYRLQRVVATARRVLALDADLGWTSFHFISKWMRERDNSIKGHLTINEHVDQEKELEVFKSKNQLIGDLKMRVADGVRCYVTSNSRKLVENLHASIAKKFPDASLLLVTSTTTKVDNDDVNRFLESPSTEALRYQVVFTSPSVSTGIDISFEDDEKVYDAVYGFFEPLILTHFECDQQLSRVRHPKAVKVWISPKMYDFETNFDVVLDDALSLEMMSHLTQGFNTDGIRRIRTDDPLLELAAAVLREQRASVNHLKRNFLDLKRAQGWTITEVDDDEELRKQGSVLALEGRNLSKQQVIGSVLRAPALTFDQARALEEKKKKEHHLTSDEEASLVRFFIESFYGQPISKKLIELDDQGRFRDAVRAFNFVSNWDFFKIFRSTILWKTKDQIDPLNMLRNENYKNLLVVDALETAKLYAEGLFSAKIFTAADLVDFATFMTRNKARYETAFNRPLNKDVIENPVGQLNSILKAVGLRAEKVKKTRSGDKSIYKYKIDFAKIQLMAEIIRRKKSVDDSRG